MSAPARLRAARDRLRHARLAVVAYFVLLGVANGDWLARIPAIRHSLRLSDGMLGIALLAGPAGLVAVVSLAGPIINRIGSRMPTIASSFAVAFLPVTFGLATGQAALMIGLFGFGVTSGLLDVAMNSQAVHVERGVGRPVMTTFHACYSFGALAGGLIGGAFAWAAIRPTANFAVVGTVLAALALAASRWLLADDGGNVSALPSVAEPAGAEPAGAEPAGAEPAGAEPGVAEPAGPEPTGARPAANRISRSARRLSPLLVLSLLALCSLLGEGAADGWSAVYLHDNLATSAAFAALGFAAFSLTMAFGRLTGDSLALRFGSSALVRAGGLVAATGMAAVLLSPDAAVAIAGFALFGAGLSCTFPQLLSAAGKVRPDRPAGAIARVAGMGYLGMLGGPVLIGGIASAAGLSVALGLPAVLALCIALGAGYVSPRRLRR